LVLKLGKDGLLVWDSKPGMDGLIVWASKPLVAGLTGLSLKMGSGGSTDTW
jgi:hypothetical protein